MNYSRAANSIAIQLWNFARGGHALWGAAGGGFMRRVWGGIATKIARASKDHPAPEPLGVRSPEQGAQLTASSESGANRLEVELTTQSLLGTRHFHDGR